MEHKYLVLFMLANDEYKYSAEILYFMINRIILVVAIAHIATTQTTTLGQPTLLPLPKLCPQRSNFTIVLPPPPPKVSPSPLPQASPGTTTTIDSASQENTQVFYSTIQKQLIQNLESGTIRVQNNQNLRSTTFSVSWNQSISNSKVTLSIQAINNFVPKTGMDFQLRVITIQLTSFTGSLTMETEASWSSILISYVVSGRADFVVGSFSSDQIMELKTALLNPSFNNVGTQFSYTLPGSKILQLQNWIIIPFLTGIKTLSNDFSFKFTGKKFNPITKELTLSILFSYSQNPIDFVSVSYLLFHNRQDLEVTSLYDPTIIPSGIHTFSGASDVTSVPTLFSGATRLLNTATQQQAFDRMFNRHGVIIQTQTAIALPYIMNPIPGAFQCETRQQCRNRGGNMVYQQIGIFDIIPICLVCKAQQVFDQTTRQCECVKGAFRINRHCVFIGCLPGWILVNIDCQPIKVCGKNFTYDEKTNQCICQSPKVLKNGICRLKAYIKAKKTPKPPIRAGSKRNT